MCWEIGRTAGSPGASVALTSQPAPNWAGVMDQRRQKSLSDWEEFTNLEVFDLLYATLFHCPCPRQLAMHWANFLPSL